MTSTTYPSFPDLTKIAFRTDDPSDHEGGGHCAGLPDGTIHARWELVLAQHLTAFESLATAALDDEDGWALTRPVLFAAHHVCEVALKAAFAAATGKEPKRGHPLEPHWTRLEKIGALKHLTVAQINETRDFIKVMADLTPDGSTTRYPLPGVDDISATWCCLSTKNLRAAVGTFLLRLYPPSGGA